MRILTSGRGFQAREYDHRLRPLPSQIIFTGIRLDVGAQILSLGTVGFSTKNCSCYQQHPQRPSSSCKGGFIVQYMPVLVMVLGGAAPCCPCWRNEHDGPPLLSGRLDNAVAGGVLSCRSTMEAGGWCVAPVASGK